MSLMTRLFIFIFLCFIAPIHAFAGEGDFRDDMERAVLCAHLMQTQANNADYVPGVDAYGNPVVSADLGTSIDGMAALRDLCDISEPSNTVEVEIEKNQSNQEEGHGHESSNPVISSDTIDSKIEGSYP